MPRRGKNINDFGRNLRNYRKRSKMTQSQLAELMGVTQETISYWESGKKRIYLASVVKLC